MRCFWVSFYIFMIFFFQAFQFCYLFFYSFQLLSFFFSIFNFLLFFFTFFRYSPFFLFLHTYHMPYNVVATKSDNIQEFGTVEHTKKNISFDTPHLVLQVALFINVDRIICSQKQCGYCELWEVAFPRWYLSFFLSVFVAYYNIRTWKWVYIYSRI